MESKNEEVVLPLEKDTLPVQAEVIELQAEEMPVKLFENKIAIIITQDTFKEVKRKGVMVKKAVKHNWQVTEATNIALTSENVSNYIIAKLADYQFLQKMQGLGSFDQSLPIQVAIQVNDLHAASGVKFSTSAKRLAKMLDTYPILVTRIFNPTEIRLGIRKDEVLKRLSQGNLMLAPAIEAVAEVQNLINAVEVADLNA